MAFVSTSAVTAVPAVTRANRITAAAVVRVPALAAPHRLLAAALLVVVSPCTGAEPAPAQQRAPLVHGVVRDEAGRALEGANVFLLETLEGSITDADGVFRVASARSGPATLVVQRIGFAEERLALELPRPALLEVTLRVAPIELERIEVRASHFRRGDAADATLSALQVVRTPGTAADVYRAIQTFPGTQGVDEGAGLFVRGGDVAETRVFLNDASVLSPYRYESPTGGFFGAFDPFQLEGIAFSSGGFGARFGDALSGVVDLHTFGRPESHGGSGTASLAAVSGTGALRLPGGLGVRATATRSQTDLLFRVNGTSSEFTDPPEGRDLSSVVTLDYRDGGQLKLFVMDQWSRLGVVIDRPSFAGALDARETHRQGLLRWTDRFAGSTVVASLARASSSRTQRFGVFDLGTSEDFAEVRVRGERPLTERLTLAAGFDAEDREDRWRGTVPDDEHDDRPGARRVVLDSGVDGSRRAAFTEVDWQPAARVRLTAGARTDRSALTDETTFDPRAAVAWRWVDGVTLTGAWGVYHQVPSPLHYEATRGLDSLPPMRAMHWIAGALLESGPVLLRAEAYRKEYADLAQRRRDGRVRGGGEGTTTGIDLFASLPLGPDGSTRLAYSRLRAVRTDPDTGLRAPSPWDVTHTLSLVLDRSWVGGRLQTAVAYRHATGRPVTPVASARYDEERRVWIPAYGPPMSDRLPAFERVDLALSTPLTLGGRFVVAFVGLTNALDRFNVHAYTYSPDFSERISVRSQFKRSVYVGASMTF